MSIRSLLLVPALGVLALVSATAAEDDALAVINGDFSNMDGLSPLQHPGWYSGVPTGWTAAPPQDQDSDFYTVRKMGAAGIAANLRVLSRLKPEFYAFKQELGVLAEMSDVTLTFDTVGFGEEEFWMGAAIVNARANGGDPVLAKQSFQAAGAQRLVATKVPAGTWVTIQFWAVKGYPGIGNVTIEVTPSS
jgi:hypothetical protein